MNKRTFFRKSLYFKILITILVLCIICCGGVFYIYYKSYNSMVEEMKLYSEDISMQIEINSENLLDKLTEKALPLNNSNEILSSALAESDKKLPVKSLYVNKALQDIMAFSKYGIWVAAVDSSKNVYLSKKNQSISIINKDDIFDIYNQNEDKLLSKPGKGIWVSHGGKDIIFIRAVFDEWNMKFCGYVMIGFDEKLIKENFFSAGLMSNNIVVIYDNNDKLFYSTEQINAQDKNDIYKWLGEEKNKNLMFTEYGLFNGTMTMLYIFDLNIIKTRLSGIMVSAYITAGIIFISVLITLWSAFGKTAADIKIIVENLEKIAKGDFKLKTIKKHGENDIEIIDRNIHKMASDIEVLMEQAVMDKEIKEQNKYNLLEMRYHELQLQVNPHFLFNILQSITAMAQIKGEKEISKSICMLARFFQGNLQRTSVSCHLYEELEYIKNYLNLYKNIYPNRLEIEWNVDPELMQINVPTYVLQPIVENSVIHGLEHKVGNFKILISGYIRNEKLVLEVWDNGCGISKDRIKQIFNEKHDEKHIGIKNVQDRIQILYGKDYGIHIESIYQMYTKVYIYLPVDV